MRIARRLQQQPSVERLAQPDDFGFHAFFKSADFT
jgi:hypothetical protein